MQQRIVEEAHKLFLTYGIRSISMDDIAHKLGISKKTIYQYFEDKDALVDAVVSIEMTHHKEECNQQKICCDNAIHEIYIALENISALLKSMRPIVFFDLKKYHPTIFKKLNAHKNHFFYEIIKDNLERGITEGLYRPEINIEILSKYRITSIFLVLENEESLQDKINLTDTMQEITEVFLYGIATPKGIKMIKKYKQRIK